MQIDRTQIVETLKSIYPFHKLDETLINRVVSNLEISSYNEGQIIFDEGASAERLFLVLTGEVKITRGGSAKDQLIALKKTGDFFGFEMRNVDGVYLTTATSATKTTILSLSSDHLKTLEDKISNLSLAMEIMDQGYCQSLRTLFKWRSSDESIYYVGRRHSIFLLFKLLPPLLIALITLPVLISICLTALDLIFPFFLIGVDLLFISGWIFWNSVDWTNDYSIITSQRVVYQKRIVMFYDSRQEAPLNAIMAISTETNQLGRLLSYGNVIVRTYAGLIILRQLKYPEQVALLLEAEWFRAKSGIARVEKKVQLEGVIRERLGYSSGKNVKDKDSKPASAIIKPSSVQSFLANMFQLRFEENGAITYRTHWFILIKRSCLPILILIGLQSLLIARLFEVFTFVSETIVMGIVIMLDLILGLWWIYEYVDWRNDCYMITDDHVIDVDKKPFGREERRAAPLQNIQSIEFERQGLVGLLFNFGTVSIRVGETKLTFDYVFNPSEVQREIFQRIALRDYKKKQIEMEDEQQSLGDWIEAYHRVMGQRSRTDSSDNSNIQSE